MNVLSLGSDERVFEAGSATRTRQLAYARALGHLDLITLARRSYAVIEDGPLSLRAASAGFPLLRLVRAYGISRRLKKPDVVTVQDPFEIGLVGCFVAKYFHVPLHVQVHTDFLSPAFARHSLLNRFRVHVAGFVLERAARVRVVSERIKSDLAARFDLAVPVTVLPVFVNFERLQDTQNDPRLITKFREFTTKLLSVGRLESEKNTALAISAFAESSPAQACLIIVGEGSARPHLEALARASRVSERVFFAGEQDPAPYYKLADLLLVTSRYEGYGLVIVEALASGMPVLSTDVGIAREAGAIVTNEKRFSQDLKSWFATGPRTGSLRLNIDDTLQHAMQMLADDTMAVHNN